MSKDPVWLDTLKHYILPVFVTAFISLIYWVRYQRASLLEVLHQDYIRTARAKGLSEQRVILRHAWRNSLIPIVTLIGFSVANLVAGSYVIEVVFSWPGMAQFGFEAILKRDYPVIMGVTLFSSLFIIVGNLLADIAYIVVNPRVAAQVAGADAWLPPPSAPSRANCDAARRSGRCSCAPGTASAVTGWRASGSASW